MQGAKIESVLDADLDHGHKTFEALASLGISLDAVLEELRTAGVDSFCQHHIRSFLVSY